MNIALESEKVIPLESNRLEMLKQIADALAAQFGPNCEVVIHDLSAQNAEHPIVYIVNAQAPPDSQSFPTYSRGWETGLVLLMYLLS